MAETDAVPYDISSVTGDTITISIHKDFDLGALKQNWASDISTRHPGPYAALRIDLSRCGLVSSTFFAGIVLLYYAFKAKGTTQFILVKPDSRLLRNMAMLKLNSLFSVEAR
jgi:hypothetical protein